MFCMRCGQEVPTAAEFCPACGQSTKLPEPQTAQSPQPTNYEVVPQPPQAQPAGYPPPPYRAAPSSLKGVNGILLVFCIFLTIVWPLWTLSQYAIRPGMIRLGMPGMLLAVNGIGLLRMAFGIAVGISLWTASRSAILLLRIYFIISIILMAWSIFGFAALFIRYSSGFSLRVFASWLIAVLPYALFLVLGIAYFSKSERVRATYGENLL